MLVRIGMGSCGIAAGADVVWKTVEQEFKDYPEVVLQRTGCIGMCYFEPIVDIILTEDLIFTYGGVNEDKIKEIINHHLNCQEPLEKYLLASKDFLTKQNRIALRNSGIIDPENIDQYIEKGGYEALKKCLFDLKPEEVIEEVKISGLRGRGGAGFPTWRKWEATRQEKSDKKFVICNADEGDPGAFMDRSILESDPHALLEGMIIAGYAIGADTGIIYVRAEYPLAVKRLEIAISQAEKKGFLGSNIWGSNFSFSIQLKQGAGAFVCGEETALIASVEGERGMPRLKPPFPSQKGLWGMPTNINNVETLANIPWIIRNGGMAFAALGTETSKGTKVFALAGKVKRGGLVEIPMGMTLREIIFDIGGGIRDDKKIKAVQLGGPSGGCIPEELLDTPVDYESITCTGAIMGSGGMIVLDETTCMVDIARFFLDFTQKESCGKCVPCRIGTKRMLEILERICEGKGVKEDIELLESLALEIKSASLCGLGQSAPNPVLTTIKYFRHEYESHIEDKKCPAKSCKALITYNINPEKCKGCGICAKRCPVNCIKGEIKQPHVIIQDECIKCGTCLNVCPPRFKAVQVL